MGRTLVDRIFTPESSRSWFGLGVLRFDSRFGLQILSR